MAQDILIQGKSFAWEVDEQGQAYVRGKPGTLRFEQVSDTLAYLGKAAAGASESASVWQIAQLTFSSQGNVTTLWPNGSTDFNFRWADRASLSYS